MVTLIIVFFVLTILCITLLIYDKIENFRMMVYYFDRKNSTKRGLKYSGSDYAHVKQRRAPGQQNRE